MIGTAAEALSAATAILARRASGRQAMQARLETAARAFLLAIRLGDARGEVGQALAQCARELDANGYIAPTYPIAQARAPGLISVVVCSVSPHKLECLRKNLAERLIGESWELIHIDDARSLCEGYNRGISRACGDLLVLCHDDIRILSTDFAAKLRAHLAQYDLIGVAGTTKATGPSWNSSGPQHMHCGISQSRISKGLEHLGAVTLPLTAFGPQVVGAQMLDGVFIALRRKLSQAIRFDEVTFDRFHFYDLDFSYRAYLSGAKTAICLDIVLFHESAGDFATDYAEYAERFRRKFPAICSSAQPTPFTLPWMSMATTDVAVTQELDWLHHWAHENNASLSDTIASIRHR